jgi:hypothetical protein
MISLNQRQPTVQQTRPSKRPVRPVNRAVSTERAADLLYGLIAEDSYLVFVVDRGWTADEWELGDEDRHRPTLLRAVRRIGDAGLVKHLVKRTTGRRARVRMNEPETGIDRDEVGSGRTTPEPTVGFMTRRLNDLLVGPS